MLIPHGSLGDIRSAGGLSATSRPDALRAWWDRNGYAVLYKRLHGATTRAPKVADPSLRVQGTRQALQMVVFEPLPCFFWEKTISRLVRL